MTINRNRVIDLRRCNPTINFRGSFPYFCCNWKPGCSMLFIDIQRLCILRQCQSAVAHKFADVIKIQKFASLRYATLLVSDSGTGAFLWICRYCQEHLFYRTLPHDYFSIFTGIVFSRTFDIYLVHFWSCFADF